jgi:5'-3' exonuclease
MGVPGFFKWLLEKERKNKNLIRNRINKKIKYLMLDTNCLLHPCINHVIDKIKDKPGYDRNKVELEIWQLITKRIDEMIDKVKPEIIYIAIDGVVPMSKILQQRQRRHRFYYDNSQNEICNSIYPITSIELTPGTEYMERIHLKMINYLKNINQIKSSKIKYIYSSYHIEGEGEHKILRYIKNNIKNNDTIVIYGLDADLLFLALSAMITNNTLDLYIMREKPIFDNKDVNLDDVNTEYNYVEIRELYNIIDPTTALTTTSTTPTTTPTTALTTAPTTTTTTKGRIPVPDFIVICYLIGNDFMPHLLTITFKKKGLDKLINAYENVVNKIGSSKTIVENDGKKFVINYDFLYELFNEIVYTERNIWRNINRPQFTSNNHKPQFTSNNHKPRPPYTPNTNPGPSPNTNPDPNTNPGPMPQVMSNKGVIVEEKIEFNNETEYYNNYLGTNELEISKSTKNHIVLKYIEGIEWCMNYYLNNTNSWSWGYPYAIAPLIQDIINYFPKNITKFPQMSESNTFGGRELCPMEQLILAIPRETYKYVLSPDLITELRQNKIIGYMFPISFSIDINKDDLYWKCPVSIPMVDYNEYVKEIKKIELLKKSSNNISLNDNDVFTNIGYKL